MRFIGKGKPLSCLTLSGSSCSCANFLYLGKRKQLSFPWVRGTRPIITSNSLVLGFSRQPKKPPVIQGKGMSTRSKNISRKNPVSPPRCYPPAI